MLAFQFLNELPSNLTQQKLTFILCLFHLIFIKPLFQLSNWKNMFLFPIRSNLWIVNTLTRDSLSVHTFNFRHRQAMSLCTFMLSAGGNPFDFLTQWSFIIILSSAQYVVDFEPNNYGDHLAYVKVLIMECFLFNLGIRSTFLLRSAFSWYFMWKDMCDSVCTLKCPKSLTERLIKSPLWRYHCTLDRVHKTEIDIINLVVMSKKTSKLLFPS